MRNQKYGLKRFSLHYKVWWNQSEQGMTYSWEQEKISELAHVQVAIVRLAVGFWYKKYLCSENEKKLSKLGKW